MGTNAAEFSVRLSGWQQVLGEDADLFVQGFAQAVANEVQVGGQFSPGTPIDTGYARASWDAGVNAEPEAPEPLEAGIRQDGVPTYAPGITQERILRALLTAKAGDTIVLVNTAPYARRLEFGWSQQAPQGMVRLTLAHAQDIANRIGEALLARRRRGP